MTCRTVDEARKSETSYPECHHSRRETFSITKYVCLARRLSFFADLKDGMYPRADLIRITGHTQESSENSGRYVSSYVQVNLLRGSEPTFQADSLFVVIYDAEEPVQAFSTCVCNSKKHPSWQETFKFYFMQSESEMMLDHVIS